MLAGQIEEYAVVEIPCTVSEHPDGAAVLSVLFSFAPLDCIGDFSLLVPKAAVSKLFS